MAEARDRSRLAAETSARAGIPQPVGMDPLQGDMPLQPLVPGQVDLAHAASAEGTLHPVDAQGRAHPGDLPRGVQAGDEGALEARRRGQVDAALPVKAAYAALCQEQNELQEDESKDKKKKDKDNCIPDGCDCGDMSNCAPRSCKPGGSGDSSGGCDMPDVCDCSF